MNLVLKATEQRFVDAYEKAMLVLQTDVFWNAIKTKERFDFTDVPPYKIAELLHSTNHAIEIISWKPNFILALRKYKKTTAVTGTKDQIALNVRKIWRPIDHIAGTIIHEAVHAIDYAVEERFGHGDNDARGKENAAPYWIGDLAISILNGTFYEHDLVRSELIAEELSKEILRNA